VFDINRWIDFFQDRRLDARTLTVQKLASGEINENWRIDAPNRRQAWVLRHYARTTEAQELDCELAAVDALARAGFPTPAPIPATRTWDPTTRLWEMVDDRPAALFSFSAGAHPPVRPGGYGSTDIVLGERVAQLAARLHATLSRIALPGRRRPERDPWRRISAFLASDLPQHPAFAELTGLLRDVHERLGPIYSTPSGLPRGLIHNDLQPLNLLIDDGGEIIALLDFDDCAQTFLAYDVASVVSSFGKDDNRWPDGNRISRLIAAYETVRPFTDLERRVLPDLLIAHAGSEAITVIGKWIALGRANIDPMDSYSARELVGLSRM
jgi:homoserine kinase type II